MFLTNGRSIVFCSLYRNQAAPFFNVQQFQSEYDMALSHSENVVICSDINSYHDTWFSKPSRGGVKREIGKLFYDHFVFNNCMHILNSYSHRVTFSNPKRNHFSSIDI